MKHTVLSWIGIALAMLVCLGAHGVRADGVASYVYVATNGNDTTGTGTIDNPYLTPSNGIAKAVADDIVYFKNGTYDITSPIVLNKKITLRGESRDGAIIRNVTSPGNYDVRRVLEITKDGVRVESLTIRDGGTKAATGNVTYAGGNIKMTANGVISNCFVTAGHGCYICTAADPAGGGNNIYAAKGTITHCIITGGWSDGRTFGGGIDIRGSVTVDTCLIAGNYSGCKSTDGNGGGIYVNAAGAKILNTTIVGNSAQHGGGIYCASSGTTVKNCIVAGNLTSGTSSGYPNWYSSDSASWANNVSCTLWGKEGGCSSLGSGSALDAPGFTDAANGDYTLAAGSKAIGLGATYDGIPVDLDGVARRDPPDAGCYQSDHPFPLTCTAKFGPGAAVIGSVFSLTGAVGNVTEGATYDYYWILTERKGLVRRFTGDRPVVADLELGYYEVYLAVSNRAVVSDNAYAYAATELHVGAPTNYVTCLSGGTPTAPYTNAATAATSLVTAMGETVPGSVVVLDEGTHVIGSTVSISKKTLVVGAGREKTIVRPSATGIRHFTLSHPEAHLEAMTLTGAKTYETGCCVGIDAGGGCVTDCALVGNTLDTSNRRKGVLYCDSADGVVDRCLISCNTNMAMGYSSGSTIGVIYMTKGVLRNSIIRNNVLKHHADAYGGHIIQLEGSARLENCTVVGNEDYGKTPAAVYLNGSNAKLVNVVMSDNETPTSSGGCLPNLSRSSGTVQNCCFVGSAAYGTDSFVAEDAGFADAANFDYRLRTDSPCRSKGLFADWMLGARDVYGNPRLHGPRRVDVGAATRVNAGFALFIK